jgi:hypothetical protein
MESINRTLIAEMSEADKNVALVFLSKVCNQISEKSNNSDRIQIFSRYSNLWIHTSPYFLVVNPTIKNADPSIFREL